jgi:hypothetical protein
MLREPSISIELHPDSGLFRDPFEERAEGWVEYSFWGVVTHVCTCQGHRERTK